MLENRESGFYYLQSRYYDPNIGRFINADAAEYAVLSAISLNDTNLFTYCWNNPINCYDDGGELPQVITDKIIHDHVLAWICLSYPDLRWTATCILYVDETGAFTGRWGFCDLYNTCTGEVWELKKDSQSRSCRTENARAQLDKYINHGRLMHQKELGLLLPYVTKIAPGDFTVALGNYIYDVNYWDEGAGILRYDYTKQLNRDLVVKKSIVTAGVLVVGAVAAAAVAPGLLVAVAMLV